MSIISISRRALLPLLSAALIAGTPLVHASPQTKETKVRAIVTEPVGSERIIDATPRFESWQQTGLISKVKLLKAHPGQKDAGFSSLAIVELPNRKAYQRWSHEAGKLFGSGTSIREASIVWHTGNPSRTPAQAVHVASLYATHVSGRDYKTYTEQYIAPNMRLQGEAGILSQATMYLQQAPAGTEPTSLLVMEYADAAAYAQRERVKAIKESIRSDISSTASSEVMLADH